MGALHSYAATVRWTGAGQTGTTTYTAYSRDRSEERRVGKECPV